MKLNKENQLLFIRAELGLNKIHTFKSDPQHPVTLFGNGIFAEDQVKIGWALNQ